MGAGSGGGGKGGGGSGGGRGGAAPDGGDAGGGPASDGSPVDAPPAGVGACSEARLLAETKVMVDGWTNRMRVCEPQQTSVYGQTDFTGDITRAACIGTECGGPGMCAVDFEWYAPVTVGRDSRGQLVANTSVHLAPRCTIRYTHGSESCLCHVDPTSTGVWMDRTWMAGLTAASSGDPGPLTFTVGAVQVSGGVGTPYGPEVATCEGSLIGADGVERCPLAPTSTNAVARTAFGDCNTATNQWFIGLSDLFKAYVATYVGTCP
jgi:hypothetical protein